MFGGIRMYYLVKPRPILETMNDHKQHLFFMRSHLWEWKQEFDQSPNYTTTLVKMVFMLTLVHLKDIPKFQLWLPKLLGQPMAFSIPMFDKWWTIEDYPFESKVEYAILNADIDSKFMEKVDLLDISGYEDTFEWIMEEYRQMLRWKAVRDRKEVERTSVEYQLLRALEGKPMKIGEPEFDTKEGAYQALKIMTQQDFAYNVDAWHKFFTENDRWVTHKGYMDYLKLLQTTLEARAHNYED